MTPAAILAVTIAAGLALFGIFNLVMWLADRVIDTLTDMTRYEDCVRYHPRCSTLPEPTDRHALLIACLLLAVVALGLLWGGYWDSAVRWVVR